MAVQVRSGRCLFSSGWRLAVDFGGSRVLQGVITFCQVPRIHMPSSHVRKASVTPVLLCESHTGYCCVCPGRTDRGLVHIASTGSHPHPFESRHLGTSVGCLLQPVQCSVGKGGPSCWRGISVQRQRHSCQLVQVPSFSSASMRQLR